jgi:predicted nucleotidyltransferase
LQITASSSCTFGDLASIVRFDARLRNSGKMAVNAVAPFCRNCNRQDMDREYIIAKLREELKSAGVHHLSLFGSYARGTTIRSTSDVDVLADFDRSRRMTLFSRAGLRLRIGDILEMPVDLADRRMLKDHVKARAEQEAVLVF